MPSYVYVPWTELYRPKRLDQVIGQKNIIKNLRAYVSSKDMPHLIFAGPPGTGKTTAVLAIAHELYGEDWRHNILDLNASDERGIDVVRGKIKDFARSAPITGANFKLIFLDEADALTPEAQQALRRTMELYSVNCRFILSANWSSKIIEPIQSRCALFRFKPLTEGEVSEMISRIAKAEGLEIDEDAVSALIEISEGDMRKTINLLQAISLLTRRISSDEVYRIAAAANPQEIAKMVDAALGGKFDAARKILNNLLLEYGMSGEEVLIQIYKDIVGRSMDDRQKVQVVDKIGEYNFRMVEGANERIQLEALLAHLALVGLEKK